MSRDLIGAYEEIVDFLVDSLESTETLPNVPDEILLVGVDEYADRTNQVFSNLAMQLPRRAVERDRSHDLRNARQSAATAERLFALAAGDFRLAASLVARDSDWFEPNAAAWELLSSQLGDLRSDMEEIKEAVGKEPDEPESGGTASSPIDPPPAPNLTLALIPPVGDRAYRGELAGYMLARSQRPGEWRDLGPPEVSGAGSDSVEVALEGIDEIVDKAAERMSDLLVGGVPLTVPVLEGVFKQFADLLGGTVGASYAELQTALRDRGRHASRAAMKLIYEGISKLTALLGSAVDNAKALAVEVGTWLANFAFKGSVSASLHSGLQTDALKAHVKTRFGEVGEAEANSLTVEIIKIANRYRKGKRWRDSGSFALRVCRVLRLQHLSPPASEIAMGVAVLVLCCTTVWIAQDHLDHPPNWKLPDLVRGVRSVVG